MSEGVAQKPKADTLATESAPPHSTLDVAPSKTDAHENTPSTVSTFPASTQSHFQPEYDPSSSTVAVGENSTKGQQLETPQVPKRSSSRSKLVLDIVSMPDPTAPNSNSIGKRGSKSSLRQQSRSGSVASNRSKEGDTQTRGEPRPKKRGGFLSILNCCGSSENANEIELAEQEVPPKKIKAGPKSGRQATPGVKEAKPEGKKEEGIGGPEYSEHRPATTPKMITRSSKDKISTNSAEQLTTKPEPETVVAEPPLPPLPAANGPKETEKRDSKIAIASEPPMIMKPEDSVVNQGEVINDRTAHQEAIDSDVAMPDAPHVTAARETDTAQELAQVQMNLPPPPPRGEDRTIVREVNPNERPRWLLPPLQPSLKGKKCLILDLDETLVHSSFKMLHQADFTIPVEIEGQLHNVYVIKRPGVDHFMKRVGELYEVVVFTASVSKYGDPLLDQLDIHKTVHHRLFRESCYHHQGNYVKDLSMVGRDLKELIIIDNSPTSYIFHPQHAVPISSWFSDAHDNELIDLIPVLEDLAGSSVRDVSMVLDVSL